MNVIINNKEIQAPANVSTLAQLLSAQGFSGEGQAVAINNRVVPKAQWESTAIEEGMKIMVIRAVCGG